METVQYAASADIRGRSASALKLDTMEGVIMEKVIRPRNEMIFDCRRPLLFVVVVVVVCRRRRHHDVTTTSPRPTHHRKHTDVTAQAARVVRFDTRVACVQSSFDGRCCCCCCCWWWWRSAPFSLWHVLPHCGVPQWVEIARLPELGNWGLLMSSGGWCGIVASLLVVIETYMCS